MKMLILCPYCSASVKNCGESSLTKSIFCPICGDHYLICEHTRASCLLAFLECSDAKEKVLLGNRGINNR